MSDKIAIEKEEKVIFIFDGESWRYEVHGPNGGISGHLKRYQSFQACAQAFSERYAV